MLVTRARTERPHGALLPVSYTHLKITEKSGNLVGVKSVENDDELMLITTEGIIIRIQVSDV